MTNQVSLSSLITADGIGDYSPIPVYDSTTGQLVKSIDLQTLRYIFKDRTIDPYRCGISLSGTSVNLYINEPIVINSISGDEYTKDPSDNPLHIVTVSPNSDTEHFNPFNECCISDMQYLVFVFGTINKLDVLTCRNLQYIEILNYSGLTDITGNFAQSDRADNNCIAFLDILDLRYNDIKHLYLIGPYSYINKLYFKYQDKFLVFLNFKNSIIYTEGLTSDFITALPTFNYDNQCTLYNISSEPAQDDFKMIAQGKNIIIKDVSL